MMTSITGTGNSPQGKVSTARVFCGKIRGMERSLVIKDEKDERRCLIEN